MTYQNFIILSIEETENDKMLQQLFNILRTHL